MKMFRFAAAALFLSVFNPAAAQWQTPNHSVPIGRGAGVIGFGSAVPAATGLPLVSNGATSDPSFQALPNSGLAPAAANTVKGAITAGSPTDIPLPSSTCAALGWTVGTGFSCGGSGGTGGVFSPLSFGAACDGTTHDEVAFQNTLNAAIAANGVLQLPVGTCLLNANITNAAATGGGYTIIVGHGKASRVTFLGSFGFNFGATAAYYNLQHFSIVCQASSTSSCLDINNATQSSSSGSLVQDITILQCGNAGIHLLNVAGINVLYNTVLTAGTGAEAGIWMDNTAQADVGPNVILGNDVVNVSGTTSFGIHLVNTGGTQVKDNNVAGYAQDINFVLNLGSGAATGLLIQGNQLDNFTVAGIELTTAATTGAIVHVSVANNTLHATTAGGSGSAGIVFATGSAPAAWATEISVIGNVIDTFQGIGGIIMQASTSFSVTGNTITDQGSTANAGITTASNSATCVVVGNLVNQYTVHLTNSAACTVAGNN